MSRRKIVNKIISSIIIIFMMTVLSDFLPRTFVQLRTFDSYVKNLEYVAENNAEDGVIVVTAHRQVTHDIHATGRAEMLCQNHSGVEYKVISFQEERSFTYDIGDMKDTRVFFEEVPKSIDAKRCQIVYNVTLHLSHGVEKNGVFKTNWFNI